MTEFEYLTPANFKTYTTWRQRYAPPIVRMKGSFVCAADQVTRYARQLADMNDASHASFHAVWEAFWQFIEQFDGNNREVLTRTFWRAYNS